MRRCFSPLTKYRDTGRKVRDTNLLRIRSYNSLSWFLSSDSVFLYKIIFFLKLLSYCRRKQTKALPFSQFRMNRMSSRERLRDHPRFDYGTRYFDVGEKANVVVSIGSHVCRELCSILVSYCTTRKSVAGLTLTMGKVFYVGKFYNIYQTLILGPAILSLALFTVCK